MIHARYDKASNIIFRAVNSIYLNFWNEELLLTLSAFGLLYIINYRIGTYPERYAYEIGWKKNSIKIDTD